MEASRIGLSKAMSENAKPIEFSIPTPEGEKAFSLLPGTSMFFVGANGTGKTRLAAWVEERLGLSAHRISAHRALNLRPSIAKISEAEALRALRTGNAGEHAHVNHRSGSRYHGNPATGLLNDFDQLIQSLFAEQSNKTAQTHNRLRAGEKFSPEPTKFERLTEIWERLLPHRKLHITGDDIRVSAANKEGQYSASEMSDGERSVFYLLGQALVAESQSVLIIDEPELHVHPSIISRLWDEIEAAREDCAFVFITHDLQFAAERVGQKFVLESYDPKPQWKLEEVPQDSGFDEELASFILGSRRPILFVEGEKGSLDAAIYRNCYPSWTVVPCGPCDNVIHSVATMRANKALTRVTCAGVVDADHRSADEVAYLATLGIATLEVCEIENLVLLPAVSEAIARTEGYDGDELKAKLDALATEVFASVTPQAKEAVVCRFVRRRVDHLAKKIDLSQAKTIVAIDAQFTAATAALDIKAIAAEFSKQVDDAIAKKDLKALLAVYDNKGGLMAAAAKHLKATNADAFQSWLTRNLQNKKAALVLKAVKASVPSVSPK